MRKKQMIEELELLKKDIENKLDGILYEARRTDKSILLKEQFDRLISEFNNYTEIIKKIKNKKQI